MRPKVTSRTTGDGERHFRYLCELKEKSRRHKCNNKDINGNHLDRAICTEIKKLTEDKSELNRRLMAGKKTFVDESGQLMIDLERLKKAQRENQKEINALVNSLAKMAGTPGEQSILDGINQRSEKNKSIQENIQELEQILQEQNIQAQSFEVLRDMLKSFADTVDDMSVEQKRLALRLIVKDIVWDGEKIHIYLFGDDGPDGGGDDIDFPPLDDGQDELDGPLCEDSIFNAPAGVGSKPDIFIRLEGRNTFDQPNRPDGNQVVLVTVGGVIFFYNVCHQPQVVLNEHIPRVGVPAGHPFQTVLLLLPGEGPGKGACVSRQPKGEK